MVWYMQAAILCTVSCVPIVRGTCLPRCLLAESARQETLTRMY